MVDGFEERDGNSAATTLCVSPNNYFMLPDGTMAETGLIEHLAQSCSALAGAQAKDAEHPPVGLIGEVKHFSTVTFGLTFGNVTLATGQAYVDEELIADINLKIFMQ